MARLLVVRHGETDWNRDRRLQGHVDVPLNAVGVDQAEAVAAALLEELGPRPRALLVTSDLARARETAARIAAALGLPVRARADLRERAYGRAEGRTWDELRRELPAETEAHRSGRDPDALPGVEPLVAFRARALGAARAVAAKADAARAAAVVVTHGGVIKALLEAALGPDKRFVVGNTALYRFDVDAATVARVV